MAIGFNPVTTQKPNKGATPAKTDATPSNEPGQLMALGAKPPDFVGDLWERLLALMSPQAMVKEDQSAARTNSEESDEKKSDKPAAVTVKATAPDVRDGVEFNPLYNKNGKVIGKKSEQGDFYGQPVESDQALA